MDLLSGMRAYIESENLISPQEQVLVAVSGGVDSVAMVHLLQTLGYPLAIAHVNFQLRGKASQLDEQLVEDFSNQLGVPYFVTHFETDVFAKEQGLSTQMAARELRYRWFEELRTSHRKYPEDCYCTSLE